MSNPVTILPLGCGDAFGSGGRFNTCFYVAAPSANFLIDCGATSLVAMKKYSISLDIIDFIVISHFHGDHFGGLPFLILEAAYIMKRTKPLGIVTPPGGKERLKALLEASYPGTSHLLEELQLVFMDYKNMEMKWLHDKGVAIRAFPVIHSAPSWPHAVRISVDNCVIAYSGDTEWTDSLIEVADKADLFICECNFFDLEVEGHLNYMVIKEKIKFLDAKRILLTHLGPCMLEKLASLPVDAAEEGSIVTLA